MERWSKRKKEARIQRKEIERKGKEKRVHGTLTKKQKAKKCWPKSKFANDIAKKKPYFDPSDKMFEEYLDKYYKLDYEDMVSDQLCRFKYCSVVANDFGLTTNDILTANEKELNQWVSVKKMSQYRMKEEEQIDIKIYQNKAKWKTNILLSLQETEQEDKKVHKKSKKGKGDSMVASQKTNKKCNLKQIELLIVQDSLIVALSKDRNCLLNMTRRPKWFILIKEKIGTWKKKKKRQKKKENTYQWNPITG